MGSHFTRQLGEESGIQLNPLRDDSEIPVLDNFDQVFGIMMRCTRGRIDKPFKVDRGNVFRRLGKGEPIRVSALNEAWVQVVEAVNKGAYEAVVQRLVTTAATIKWAVVRVDPDSGEFLFSVFDEVPEAPFLVAVKHLECFNDGIRLEFRADEKRLGGVELANDRVTLRLTDREGLLLYEFTGSLDQKALDDYGNSAFLPDVAQSRTDAVEIEVGMLDATMVPGSAAYGYDEYGRERWAKSGILVCFDEGGSAYTMMDYLTARERLQYTPLDFGFLVSGGSQSPALLAQLAQLAFDTNRQFRFDVAGNLTPEAAAAFVEQLNMGASPTAHLMHAFWAPLKSNDPTGINPKGYIGTAALNVAYACGRNAQTNDDGLAPKHYPIAGREWPIQRTGITQTYTPRGQELNALARAKINPVLYESYSGGGRYVFRDSLTCALVDSSQKKLISVADMSTHIDEAVVRFGKVALQKPMLTSVKWMRDFLRDLFEAAVTAEWLVPSDEPEMDGKAWRFIVRPNASRPYERMEVNYWLRYNGTTRQIFISQTLSR